MIRSELVQKLCSDFPDLTQREVENVVAALFDSITDQLAKGGRVESVKVPRSAPRAAPARERASRAGCP